MTETQLILLAIPLALFTLGLYHGIVGIYLKHYAKTLEGSYEPWFNKKAKSNFVNFGIWLFLSTYSVLFLLASLVNTQG